MAVDAGTRTELCRSWVLSQRALPPDPQAVQHNARTHSGPQAQEPLSQWTEVWPTLYCAAAFQHNAHNLRTPKHARRTPKHGVAIAMDGGMADTACYYTGR